jgi:hypothetical protein
MAFEWKLIGEDMNNDAGNVSPAEQSVKSQPVESMASQVPTGGSEPASRAEDYKPTSEAVSSLPKCELHNSAVNSTEKSGYNGTYDSGVYSSYDTGVNSEENSVVG